MKCPFCKNGITSNLRNTPFLKCKECGLFINKFMSKNAIKQTNKNFLLSACTVKQKRDARIKEAHDVQCAMLEKYIDIGTVYDIGAASGFFMKAATDRGWQAHGNEISHAAIKWAKDNYNIVIDYGFLEEIKLRDKSFNAAILWNSLEHTYDPYITLKICHSILKKNGLILIKVPNKKTPEELMRHYEIVHLFEFTNECLSYHLQTIGFKKIYENINQINPNSGVNAATYLYKK